MKTQYRKNILLLYALSFFDGFILAYVIERLFWAERGMTVTMVVSTEILYGIVVAFVEIPSGILADLIGRKKMLLIAGIFSILELIIIYFAHGYVSFAIAIIIAGISGAAESGSLQALMYESLAMEKKEAEFEVVYGRFHVFDTIGATSAALVGGISAYYLGLEFNYLVSIVSKVIAFGLMLCLMEVPRQTLEDTRVTVSTFYLYLKEGAKFFKDHNILFCYCVNGMVLGASWNYIDEFWQLLMQAVQVPVYFFGVISVLYSVFTIPGNLFVNRLKNKISYRFFFTMIPFIYGGCFVLVANMSNYWVLLPLIFMGVWHGFLEPLLNGVIQHNTLSSVRATVESMISFLKRLISIGVGLIFSQFAEKNIFTGFGSLGILCIVYGCFNLTSLRKRL